MTNKQKLIRALDTKKQRDIHNMFVGEGTKTVRELSRNFKCAYIMSTSEWASANTDTMSLADESQIVTREIINKTRALYSS